jgi:hypothetical protein
VNEEREEDVPSPELRAFIYSCIDSVEQVQVLDLLSSSDTAMTARGVAERASLSDTAARHHLESMAARGLVAITVGSELSYRYAPKSDALRRYGDLLVAQYRRAPMSVIRLIASTVAPSVKRIADAFRLRARE